MPSDILCNIEIYYILNKDQEDGSIQYVNIEEMLRQNTEQLTKYWN